MLRIDLSYDAGAYGAAIDLFEAAVLQAGMVEAVNTTVAAVAAALQRGMLDAFDRPKPYADVHSLFETSRIAVTYGHGASRIDVGALDEQIGTSVDAKEKIVLE